MSRWVLGECLTDVGHFRAATVRERMSPHFSKRSVHFDAPAYVAMPNLVLGDCDLFGTTCCQKSPAVAPA